MTSFTQNRVILQGALFSFILAGLGGFLYRLGFIYPLPFELNLENIRHAHSHLMFFGWAALLPMYLIKETMAKHRHSVGHGMMGFSLWMSLILGLLAFPAFLMWGYHPVVIGGAHLPIAAMTSGLVMIGWYLFMAGYLIVRSQPNEVKPIIWFDAALLMLFISSLGAWGVGLSGIFQIGGVMFGKALTHFFLATFSEGWVILVLLGLIVTKMKLKENDFIVSQSVLVGLISLGAPLVFSYGIPKSLLTLNLSVLARMGGVLVAEGILLFVISIVLARKKKISIWLWPLLFLMLKTVMQLTASVSPSDLWLSDHGVRILYLHVTLLGAFTMGISAYLTCSMDLPQMWFNFILIAVSLVIASLFMLTGFWPAAFSGMWIYNLLAIFALFPIIAVSIFWVKLRKAVMSSNMHPDELNEEAQVNIFQ